jgi:hypothetical protein
MFKKLMYQKLILHVCTRYIHGWGTQKECFAQNHSYDTTLNDHYVYKIVYLVHYFFPLDNHILLD